MNLSGTARQNEYQRYYDSYPEEVRQLAANLYADQAAAIDQSRRRTAYDQYVNASLSAASVLEETLERQVVAEIERRRRQEQARQEINLQNRNTLGTSPISSGPNIPTPTVPARPTTVRVMRNETPTQRFFRVIAEAANRYCDERNLRPGTSERGTEYNGFYNCNHRNPSVNQQALRVRATEFANIILRINNLPQSSHTQYYNQYYNGNAQSRARLETLLTNSRARITGEEVIVTPPTPPTGNTATNPAAQNRPVTGSNNPSAGTTPPTRPSTAPVTTIPVRQGSGQIAAADPSLTTTSACDATACKSSTY